MRPKTSQLMIKAVTDVLTFGKYKDLSIRKIIDIDPDYIAWVHKNTATKFSQEILGQAEDESINQSFSEAMDGHLKGMRFWDIYNDD